MYVMNFKYLKKEFEEDTINWKDLPCSWVGRINIVKMAILPKTLYRFNVMSIKIPAKILHRHQKNNTQLHMKKQKLRIAKTTLSNKGTSGGITIPDFKLYCRATVMKTAWYWNKNRHKESNQRSIPI